MLNGQRVLDGREVTLTEDPCLKCQCSNKRLTCIKKACPILPCPASLQVKDPGSCCYRCKESRTFMNVQGTCIIGKEYMLNGKIFSPDRCSKCTCMNGTSVCRKNTCPVLECAPEFQTIDKSDCNSCPKCPPPAEASQTCTHKGHTKKVQFVCSFFLKKIN